jgi:hypothetical protein
MTRNIPKFCATTLSLLAFAMMPGAARAQGYTGSWPFTITEQVGPFAGQTTTYCIKLTETTNCSGRTHCGEAIVGINHQLGLYFVSYGSFQTIGQLIMVTIAPDGDGESAWVFVAPTSSTTSIGTGVFNFVFGGESEDSGLLTVGAKHGCVPYPSS